MRSSKTSTKSKTMKSWTHSAGSRPEQDGRTDVDTGAADSSAEVGGEGGSFGDVEIDVDQQPGIGSEAGETWRPADKRSTRVPRDETGRGRRSP
jgi:hypothetical protein